MAAYTGPRSGEREEKVKGSGTRVHPAVDRFWGRRLNPIDLEICEVLGWIRLVGKGRARRWVLTTTLEGYEGQIYRGGVLPSKGQIQVDDQIYDFLLHYQRRDLDPFLSPSDFRLRIILTLVDLEISGLAVRQVEEDGTIHFAAAEHLATLRRYCSDHDADNGGAVLPPVVRVGGALVWDCGFAPDDGPPQVTLRH
jgi:hypothetical protein